MAEIVDSIAENREKTVESLIRDEEVFGGERRRSLRGGEKNGGNIVRTYF